MADVFQETRTQPPLFLLIVITFCEMLVRGFEAQGSSFSGTINPSPMLKKPANEIRCHEFWHKCFIWSRKRRTKMTLFCKRVFPWLWWNLKWREKSEKKFILHVDFPFLVYRETKIIHSKGINPGRKFFLNKSFLICVTFLWPSFLIFTTQRIRIGFLGSQFRVYPGSKLNGGFPLIWWEENWGVCASQHQEKRRE